MRTIRLFLIILLFVVTISAIVGGIDFMIYSNGLLFRLHPIMLEHTPFSSFFLPGLFSLLIVGGTSMVALLLIRDDNLYALPASLASGVIVLVWVSLVSFIFKDISWIEVIYWIVGLKIVLGSLYIQKIYDKGRTAI